jgi:hypothetical protein
MIDDADAALLKACIAWADEAGHEDAAERWRRAFEDMLKRDRPLSDAQRKWVVGVHEHLGLGVHYTNDWSAGRVPRGEALATPVPEVLRRPLPKKPPGRP